MGMFDIVMVPCPKCGKCEEFQSKSGDCMLTTYSLSECPENVLRNINRHAPVKCSVCETMFYVKSVPISVEWTGEYNALEIDTP